MFAPALSQVFENLKQHYVQNYDDVALKMGGIVLLLQELMVGLRSCFSIYPTDAHTMHFVERCSATAFAILA